MSLNVEYKTLGRTLCRTQFNDEIRLARTAPWRRYDEVIVTTVGKY